MSDITATFKEYNITATFANAAPGSFNSITQIIEELKAGFILPISVSCLEGDNTIPITPNIDDYAIISPSCVSESGIVGFRIPFATKLSTGFVVNADADCSFTCLIYVL